MNAICILQKKIIYNLLYLFVFFLQKNELSQAGVGMYILGFILLNKVVSKSAFLFFFAVSQRRNSTMILMMILVWVQAHSLTQGALLFLR